MLSASSILELDRLGLRVGGGRVIFKPLELGTFVLGAENYRLIAADGEEPLEVKLQVSRMQEGYAVKLETRASLKGPCMRCLENAGTVFEAEAWEVEVANSPYLREGVLKLEDWARDLLGVQIPFKVICSPDCKGLCGECGANLNLEPHDHKEQLKPRFPILDSWVKGKEAVGPA